MNGGPFRNLSPRRDDVGEQIAATLELMVRAASADALIRPVRRCADCDGRIDRGSSQSRYCIRCKDRRDIEAERRPRHSFAERPTT